LFNGKEFVPMGRRLEISRLLHSARDLTENRASFRTQASRQRVRPKMFVAVDEAAETSAILATDVAAGVADVVAAVVRRRMVPPPARSFLQTQRPAKSRLPLPLIRPPGT
jgi:hypothetical protein